MYVTDSTYQKQSQDSSVGMATGYGLDDRVIWVRFLEGTGNFLFATASRPALGPTQPPIQWVLGGGVFPWGKAAGA
jgi:hypothetical protein